MDEWARQGRENEPPVDLGVDKDIIDTQRNIKSAMTSLKKTKFNPTDITAGDDSDYYNYGKKKSNQKKLAEVMA